MELPQLGTPPSSNGIGRGSTNCRRGNELRKGLPFASPTLCTEDARVEKRRHYCFWTKDPKSSALIAGWSVAYPDIAIAIAAVSLSHIDLKRSAVPTKDAC